MGWDNVISWSGNHHTHLVTKTWLPDALLRGCPSPRARGARVEPAARRPLVTAMIRRKPEFPQRVGRDAHTHLVTTCRLPDQEITLSQPGRRPPTQQPL